MLVKGAPVLCDSEGSRKLVEELQIGEHIYDPLAEKSVEIVDILSRKIDLSKWPRATRAALTPLQIFPASIARNIPYQTVRVSPSQPVFFTDGSGRRKVLRCDHASALAKAVDGVESCIIRRVEYFAIFTEASQVFNVGGLLVQGFSPEIYDADFLTRCSTAKLPSLRATGAPS